jgi:uncharacterized protein
MHPPQFFMHKTALITGASSGIGESIAKNLAGQGIKVVLVARREDRLVEISKEIIDAGGMAIFYIADLTSESARFLLWKKLQDDNLVPDILVNNAGIGWYGYFYKMPWSIAKNLLRLNINSMVHLTSLLLPSMLMRNYGHIINIGSISGKLPEQGIALYSSTKAFMDSFTTILYRELVGSSVHVSVIRAGPIKTEFFDAARKMENGGSIPAEKFATSVTSVSNMVWKLLTNPRKVVYVPGWMIVSPLLESLFDWAIDLAGPLLLKTHKNKND